MCTTTTVPRDGNAYFDHSENVQYHQEEKSIWFWERKVNAGAEKPTLFLFFLYIYRLAVMVRSQKLGVRGRKAGS